MARRKTIINQSTEKIIIYAVGAGITYFLIVKPILVKLGIVKSAAELEADRINTGNTVCAVIPTPPCVCGAK